MFGVSRQALRHATSPGHRLVLGLADRASHSARGQWPSVSPPPMVLVSVYRAANAGLLKPHIELAQRVGWRVALWALDHPHPDLLYSTVGVGPGPRFRHVNHLLAQAQLGSDEGLLLVDDDVSMAHGSLAELVRIGSAAGLSVFQPAHAPDSSYSYPLTRARPASLVRETSFVEIGPVVAVTAAAVARLFPAEVLSDADMGWGVDAQWAQLRTPRFRFGVVDAVRVRHQAPVGAAYDTVAMDATLSARLARAGVDDVQSAQRTLQYWRPWQPRPPWM